MARALDDYPESIIHPKLQAYYEKQKRARAPMKISKSPEFNRAEHGERLITRHRSIIRKLRRTVIVQMIIIALLIGAVIAFGIIKSGEVVSLIEESVAHLPSDEYGSPRAFPPSPSSSLPSTNPIEQPTPRLYHITHYYAEDSATTASLHTVAQARRIAEEMGVDGFCAVGPDTPWYSGVREFPPQKVRISSGAAAGIYAVLDRCPREGIVDVFHQEEGLHWSYYSIISEVE